MLDHQPSTFNSSLTLTLTHFFLLILMCFELLALGCIGARAVGRAALVCSSSAVASAPVYGAGGFYAAGGGGAYGCGGGSVTTTTSVTSSSSSSSGGFGCY